MKRFSRHAIVGSAITLLAGIGALSAPSTASTIPTVAAVDLERYVGTWYEIARLPQWFERGCFAATATYTLRDDGRIGVVNTCRVGALEGREKSVSGLAWATDETNSKLKVRFFWPFAGDYWVLALGNDYEYALVGSPDLKSLWILSRTPALDLDTTSQLLDYARTLGFAVEEMEATPQPGGN